MQFERLENLLRERGTTIYGVSKATGVSTSVLYDWKKGRCVPKATTLYSIAKHFGVPMEYFMED